MVSGEKVVSQLRVMGRFTGIRGGVVGAGQRIDYLAANIMRVRNGKIVENWHVEDHVALHHQNE